MLTALLAAVMIPAAGGIPPTRACAPGPLWDALFALLWPHDLAA